MIKRSHHYYRRRAVNSDIDRHLSRVWSLTNTKYTLLNFFHFQLAWRMQMTRDYLEFRNSVSFGKLFFITTLYLSESVLHYVFWLIFLEICKFFNVTLPLALENFSLIWRRHQFSLSRLALWLTFLSIKINKYEERGDLAGHLYRLPSECVIVLINNIEQLWHAHL